MPPRSSNPPNPETRFAFVQQDHLMTETERRCERFTDTVNSLKESGVFRYL